MKTPLLIAAIALASAAFTLSAQAQTGRPAVIEVPASSDAPRAVVADEELGSYGRYLMLNGARREVAIAAARNVDHPAAHRQVVTRERASQSGKSSLFR